MDKNVDNVNALEEHKKFLYSVFEKENKSWVEKQERNREQKLQKIKSDWIEFNKLHKDQFTEDDFNMADERGGKPVKNRIN